MWNGITLYGRLDFGAGYESHGVPFNGNYPNGVETLISKNSNRPLNAIDPNGKAILRISNSGQQLVADMIGAMK
jgi:hypothetical protein